MEYNVSSDSQDNIQHQVSDMTSKLEEKELDSDIKNISIDKKEIEKSDFSAPKTSNKDQENSTNHLSNPSQDYQPNDKKFASIKSLSLDRLDNLKKSDNNVDINEEETSAGLRSDKNASYQEDILFSLSDKPDLAYRKTRKESNIPPLSLMPKNIQKDGKKSENDLLYQEDIQFSISDKHDLSYRKTRKEVTIKLLSSESEQARVRTKSPCFMEDSTSTRYKIRSVLSTSSRTFLF